MAGGKKRRKTRWLTHAFGAVLARKRTMLEGLCRCCPLIADARLGSLHVFCFFVEKPEDLLAVDAFNNLVESRELRESGEER